jgi:gliding motility-associated-like protein
MKIRLAILLLISLYACVFQSTKAQTISNEGTDFWAVFPTHDPNREQLASINIFITSKKASEVTVSCGVYKQTKKIPANTVVAFAVPRNAAYIGTEEANKKLTNRGIHIQVSPGKPPVAVYEHVYAGARSAASLILPFEALGQKYFSMNYTQDGFGSNFLVLVAAEDNTTLKLTEKDGTIKTIILDKAGDVYEYMQSGFLTDLTGTYVEVDPTNSKCKRFAAFSGNTSVSIGCDNTRDPLLQQLYTTSSWGKSYAVAPFFGRNFILRVLAQEDNTMISVGGDNIILNKGQFYETAPLTTGVMVTASKTVSVAQYALTQICSSASGLEVQGDPDMILLNPIEFNIKKITLFSSDKQNINEKYINVVIKTNSIESFKVNGAEPENGAWTTFESNPDYSYIQIEVADESLTLTANDGFNATAYGFGSVESYGYSAGTSLAANQYLKIISKRNGQERNDACIDEASDFKVTLPYLFTRLVWEFDDGTADYDDTAPVPKAIVVNGQKLYEYFAPINKTYTTVGERTLKITGYLATDADNCLGGSAEFEFNFDVDPLPTASFDLPTEVCAATELQLTDASTSNLLDKSINSWLWDFGDGTAPSALQNPTHQYRTFGVYNIKLIVGVDDGCTSEVLTKTVKVLPKIMPSFKVEGSACASLATQFKDLSTVEDGSIINWEWDFGDGGAKSSDQHPSHIYGSAGEYTITLVVTSSDGCVNTTSQNIYVNPIPIVDFEMPDVCLADRNAVFVNKSTISNNEELSYLWEFGDPNANAQRPNTSSQKDGSHIYTAVGLYNVTLTIRTAAGCAVTIKKLFRVNGSVPKANFDINDQKSLCSSAAVEVTDKASVDFGEITKIEWYFDYANKTTPDVVDEQPNARNSAAKSYQFKYPTFTDAASKTYTIKMKVYSGISCTSEVTRDVTIYPGPVVNFTLQSACLPNGKATFNNLSSYITNTGLSYLWDFGDSYANTQNPNIAIDEDVSHIYSRPGKYQVTLTATTANGCISTLMKEITVEGAAPIADFSVENAEALCVLNPVVFKENISLAFGEVTRIDWFYDFANNPSQVETDNMPGKRNNPKTYSHQYPLFYLPFTQSYVVKMVAYAGNSCVASIEKTITLNAIPEIDFNAPSEICSEQAGVQLLTTEKNNLMGMGDFSGPGVSSSGFFDPAKAGVGTHTITYTFAVSGGCTLQKTQTIKVYPTPVVSAGEDKTVLEGGQIILSASAFGDNLTYKWTPAAGLSRDDILNPVVKPVEDMTYVLTVTSENGCVQVDDVSIAVARKLDIPNTITPNGDSVNDAWKINYIDSYPQVTVEIYDRAGQAIFKSKGYTKPFDGTFNNNPVPVGTYYYIITLAAGKKPLTGTLTVIR